MSAERGVIRVLAVDDHELLRKGIAALVEVEPDIRLVAEATNGREALQQYRAHRPDVTLMDLQMPEMSGLDAIIAIRGEFPEARIVVLSGFDNDRLVSQALALGADHYVPKGGDPDEIVDAVAGKAA